MIGELVVICEPIRVNLDVERGTQLAILEGRLIQVVDSKLDWTKDRDVHISVFEGGDEYLAMLDLREGHLSEAGINTSNPLYCITKTPFGKWYLTSFVIGRVNSVFQLVARSLGSGLAIELCMDLSKVATFKMGDDVLILGAMSRCSLVLQKP